jgi:hypothetical protein
MNVCKQIIAHSSEGLTHWVGHPLACFCYFERGKIPRRAPENLAVSAGLCVGKISSLIQLGKKLKSRPLQIDYVILFPICKSCITFRGRFHETVLAVICGSIFQHDIQLFMLCKRGKRKRHFPTNID